MSITGMSALELGKKIRAREISVLEATEAVLESVRRKEPAVNAFITVDEEGARRRAGKVQKQIDEGALTGPLAGVPVVHKGRSDYLRLENAEQFCSALYCGGCGKLKPGRGDCVW